MAADIGDQHERRAALVGGQTAGVVAGLSVRLEHGRVPGGGLHRQAGLLGLAHQTAAAIQVDAADAGAAVGVPEDDAALEYVGVVGLVGTGRVRRRQVQQRDQLGEKQLVVGQLGAAGVAPAGDKGVDARLDGVGIGHAALPSPCVRRAV